MYSRSRTTLLLSASIAAILLSVVWAAPDQRPAKKRAAPPKFKASDVEQVFFTDARTALVGKRPANVAAGKSIEKPVTDSQGTPPDSDAGPQPAAGAVAWSSLVSAETLVDEVKVYPTLLAAVVKTPTQFKGNGAKSARRYFSTIAAVFAIITKYDGEIRWKDQAGAARELFARAGFNSKSDNENVYNEAKQRVEDLAALVGGETIAAPAKIEPNPSLNEQVANRPPLMWRLERALQDRLAVWTSNPAEFNKNLDGIKHEAEMVAAIAQLIQHPSYTDADSESYTEYAKALQKSALEMRQAAKEKNAAAARTAAGNLSKACANCHTDFRGG